MRCFLVVAMLHVGASSLRGDEPASQPAVEIAVDGSEALELTKKPLAGLWEEHLASLTGTSN
jgi:hypothetical protein